MEFLGLNITLVVSVSVCVVMLVSPDKLAKVAQSKKVVYSQLEFVDIAGK